MALPTTFQKYTTDIKYAVNKIPDENVLFWGAWFCEYLFHTYGETVNTVLSTEDYNKIESGLAYIWQCVDIKATVDIGVASGKYQSLQKTDETGLDQTDENECAVYELIISLDAVLKFLINNLRGWEYNVSQSTINVIDKILATKDIDLITTEGFNNQLTTQEVEAQFNMIDFLTDHKSVTSDQKTLFRK